MDRASVIFTAFRSFGNKMLHKIGFSASVCQIKIPREVEHGGADEIHEQILHRVNQPDVYISAYSEAFGVDFYVVDPADGGYGVFLT